jgi:[ribosomal protein S5]-alanine N-acetyltransferase
MARVRVFDISRFEADMSLFDWLMPGGGLQLEGKGLRLRPGRMGDYAQWSKVRGQSKSFLQPWEPTWRDDELTRGSFRRRLSAYSYDLDRHLSYPLFIFRESDFALVGGITLGQVRRGVIQSATIGYWIGEAYAGNGYASAAVETVVSFAFNRLALHRVEAACVPDNMASMGVLIKQGFQLEGRASSYLKINGVWRDHLLFGLVSPE